MDLLFLNIGALNVTKKDKQIISAIKNKTIFEKEAGLYQKEFFEKTIGAKYVDEAEKEIVKKYLKNIDKNACIKILDIGPGGGRWSKLMLNYFPNSEVFACDLSEGMVRDLKQKFKKETRFKVVVGDMQKLPFKDDSFDFVISIRAIKYAQNQKKVFEEIYRVLKFNGKGIIELPYLNFIYILIRKFKIFGKISEYANRIVLSDEKKVKEILQKAGFKIEFFDKFFTVPATFYKNCKSEIYLLVLNKIDFVLPRSIFGRSLFITVKKNG
ncbi:MAG: class I SAM-dependent methyltransferase [Candidatus Taylorbacteria bacterium]|nr:class I SAM-dependent methyltransferase [Candidatus Taylorbacteria bacterium]